MDLSTDIRRERAERAYSERLRRDGEPDMRACSVCGGEFVSEGEDECDECKCVVCGHAGPEVDDRGYCSAECRDEDEAAEQADRAVDEAAMQERHEARGT